MCHTYANTYFKQFYVFFKFSVGTKVVFVNEEDVSWILKTQLVHHNALKSNQSSPNLYLAYEYCFHASENDLY